MTAAMQRYGVADRVLVELEIAAGRLIDLRDSEACAALGVDVAGAGDDWIAAIERGAEPPSWRIADRARAAGAEGLIDGSRKLPGAWHIVLFEWNVPGGASVAVIATGGRRGSKSRVVGRAGLPTRRPGLR